MTISTKCQYALRAVYEIAHSQSGRVLTIADIASAQQVPQRYLEGILNQLRKGTILEAQRGRRGGYRLAREAAAITVGDVVRLIDGPIQVVACLDGQRDPECPMSGDCVFLPTWQKVQASINGMLDETTFENLMEQAKAARENMALNYAI